MYDKADPALRADLSLSYAYHVPLDYDNFNLSFGISSKLIYYNLDYTELEIPVLNDNTISNKTYTKTSPEAQLQTFVQPKSSFRLLKYKYTSKFL